MQRDGGSLSTPYHKLPSRGRPGLTAAQPRDHPKPVFCGLGCSPDDCERFSGLPALAPLPGKFGDLVHPSQQQTPLHGNFQARSHEFIENRPLAVVQLFSRSVWKSAFGLPPFPESVASKSRFHLGYHQLLLYTPTM